jgi:adenylate kinase
MRILLVGAPGSGKGTQAKLLSQALGLAHLSSGELLRRHISMRTPTGRRAEPYVSRGDLVPDAIVMDMLRKPVITASSDGGYILDGFPRTVQQAQMAHRTARTLGVDVQVVIHLDVESAELVQRLMARGRGEDDAEDVIRHRLQVYREQTLPMLDYYARRRELITVDGGAPIAEVHRIVRSQLDVIRPRLSATSA